MGGLATYILLYGGSRCVSGDTILDGHTKTIKELAEEKSPVKVYTSHGVQLAEPPFLKGTCKMLTFEIESGESVTVTPDHRFWNGQSWIRADLLKTGQKIGFQENLQYFSTLDPTNSEFSLSMFLASVPRLRKKLEDYQDDCSLCPRRYGQQLRRLLAFFSAYYASQLYVQVHSRLDRFEYLRELNIHDPHLGLHESIYSLVDHTLPHLSMKGDFPSSYQLDEYEDPFFLQIYELFQVQLEKYPITPSRFYFPQSSELAFRSFFDRCAPFFFHDNFSCDIPSNDGYKLKRIALITETAEQEYYTLHVPNCEQYFANGFLHHNSGKTAIFIYAIFIRAIYCPGSRHLIARYRFNHAKTSLWYDTLPKIAKLMGIYDDCEWNKSDWFIKIGESEIWIAGLDDKDRVEKVLGNEYATIYLNEASQISYSSFNTVKTRLAQKCALKNKMYIDCNPPTKKHWIYQVFKLFRDAKQRTPLKKAQYASMLMNPKDNLENIAEGYLEILASMPERQRKRFEDGEFLDEIEGALFKQSNIDKARVDFAEDLTITAVSIDPAVTNNENSDETGIIVGGVDDSKPLHGYVLEDASDKYSPEGWGQKAVDLYHEYDCDFIVAESNQGGDMVKHVIHNIDPNIKVYLVRATKGKMVRAEPISAIYEQNRIHHVGLFPELEEELTTYTGNVSEESPDRMDALVWLFSKLMLGLGGELASMPSASGGSYPLPQ